MSMSLSNTVQSDEQKNVNMANPKRQTPKLIGRKFIDERGNLLVASVVATRGGKLISSEPKFLKDGSILFYEKNAGGKERQ